MRLQRKARQARGGATDNPQDKIGKRE